MKLVRWEANGYKSIEDAGFDFSDQTILIGKNNSGKSNIIDSLSDFQSKLTGSHSTSWFPQSVFGKITDRSITITLETEFSEPERNDILEEFDGRVQSNIEDMDWLTNLKVRFNAKWDDRNELQREVEKFTNWEDEWYSIRDLRKLRGANNPHSPIEEIFDQSLDSWKFSSPFRVPRDSVQARRTDTKLDRDGSNLIEVLATLKWTDDEDIFNNITDKYVEIMEGVEDVKIKYDQSRSDDFITISIEENRFDNPFKAAEISSGSKEILALLTQIYLSQQDTDLLAIEEPELHLHPGAAQKVHDVIRDLVEHHDTQVIITTHSDVFVNQGPANGIVKVDRDNVTEIRSVSEGQIQDELVDLGYSKSGLLQSDAVVFVEGLSDKLIIRQWASNMDIDLDDKGISIVELEGGGNVRTHGRSLVKLLYSFDIPYLFIIDSDKRDANGIEQELVNEINRNKDDGGWWHTTPDHFHAWEDSDIEHFLLETPEAIATAVGESKEKINSIIEESDSTKNVENLREIWEEVYDDPHGETGYQKDIDGKNIAKHMDDCLIPIEPKKILKKIEKLAG